MRKQDDATTKPRAVRRPRPGPRGGEAKGWLVDPKNAVLLALALAVGIGGGRRLLMGRRARRAVERLGESDVTPETVQEAARHGRAPLMELFRLLTTADDKAIRDAAGKALATLWAEDQLIAEEEKAIVTRGFAVDWHARRRYPRALRRPFAVGVKFGLPFLSADGPGVTPKNLAWSYRVLGAQRATLEEASPWRPGPMDLAITIDPADFPTNGPHRLVLRARVRTAGLTDSWELELPHAPFSFEFDPLLSVDALLAAADDARADAIARAVRLEAPAERPEGPTLLDLGPEFALRNPPDLAVATPLPCDLAHTIALEFEGVPGTFPAGSLVVSGQGGATAAEPDVRRFPIGPNVHLPPGTLDRPGEHRLRARLVADPSLGWADPDVRSIWPGAIVTDWHPVQVLRR